MTDPVFRTEIVPRDRHPFVPQRALTGHVLHEADIIPHRPGARVIDEIRILLLFLYRELQCPIAD
jgi:hypothetical protein